VLLDVAVELGSPLDLGLTAPGTIGDKYLAS